MDFVKSTLKVLGQVVAVIAFMVVVFASGVLAQGGDLGVWPPRYSTFSVAKYIPLPLTGEAYWFNVPKGETLTIIRGQNGHHRPFLVTVGLQTQPEIYLQYRTFAIPGPASVGVKGSGPIFFQEWSMRPLW